MSSDDEYKKKPLNDSDKDGEGGETGTGSGTGGQGGKIAFRDFLATGENLRDDLLPFEERKRLLATHKDINEVKVKQQKEKRDHYKDLKNGKIALNTFRGLMGKGMSSQFKPNPILANQAQFSGIDKQVTGLPNENLAETNQDKRDELLNELRYRLGYEARPSFNPKPHGPG